MKVVLGYQELFNHASFAWSRFLPAVNERYRRGIEFLRAQGREVEALRFDSSKEACDRLH